ncbi:MAG: EAL domain-containing protein [Azonexus sp.]|jgi:EAL domain-containing protein (putative c-di-GMP-specific phosphodiesterase class I)|uniref:EAL domain-containing protein n=1 Tax=Azonexus sp. TaxID=1872668 RepID=UPI0028286A04|nr:EAL domain-containing protein [Azonexus sp.]MDR0775537.1 EAL domain-containing protein [Azonexus sp.]
MSDITLLVIDLADCQRLFDIFGEDAINRALDDLGRACPALIRRLLAQHEIIEQKHDRRDRWSARFRLGNDELRDREETLTSLRDAGQQLLRETLVGIFGNSTGMRVRARLALLPEENDPAAGEVLDLCFMTEIIGRNDAESIQEITNILGDGSLRTVVQPIVRLSDRRLLGYEALSRGPRNSPLESPDRLFAAAAGAGLTVEAELACARLALERTAKRVPAGQFLSINLGPAALARAIDSLPLAGRDDVIIEITEHLPLDAAEELRDAVAHLRELGLRLSLDDTGCGFADLETVRVLQPDIVKLCITIIRNAALGDPFITAIRKTVAQLHEQNIQVLAEGVETEAQHQALAGCGIELAQGWLYGRPQELDTAFGPRAG